MVSAKEHRVHDIEPASFIIEILEEEHKPVTGIKFNVAIDGNVNLKETDKDGIFKVPKTQSEIKLYLISEAIIETSEELGEISGEGETLQKFEVQDTQPENFVIEVLDYEQKPIAGITFSVAIDAGDVNTKETDNEGVFKVPKPQSEIQLSLVSVEINAP